MMKFEIPAPIEYDPSNQLEITVIGDRDASSAHVMYTDPKGTVYHGVGTSKRHPKDRFKQHIGANLAVARALEELAWRLTCDLDDEVYG